MNIFKRAVSAAVTTGSLAAIAFVGGGTSEATAVRELPPTNNIIGDLVDKYEQHDMFRGVANSSLPATASGGLQLGVVTVLPDLDNSGCSTTGTSTTETSRPPPS